MSTKSKEFIQSKQSSDGSVLVYFDNSNIFINTQQFAAKKHKFKFGITQDWRARVDVGKLFNKACAGRHILQANLYGSEPPALDSFWKAVRMRKIKVSHFPRSKWNDKEKRTDTKLCTDAVEAIVLNRGLKGERTVILFTGDGDMVDTAQTALRYDYNVEIWSFEKSLSPQLSKLAKQNDRVKIFLIDNIFDEIAMWALYWNKPLPPERTIILKLKNKSVSSVSQRKATMDRAVQESTKILEQPTMGKYINDEDQYLAIIPIHKQNTLMNERPIKYDFNRDVWSRAEELRKAIPSILECLTYSTYKNEISSQKVEETYDFYEDPEDESITDGMDSYAAEIEDDGFILVARKEPRKHLKYSDHCIHNFRCRMGLKCAYSHTDKEKEFFKAVPDFRMRYNYKTKPCIRAHCPSAVKSYLCSYAHGQEEFYCRSCNTTGDHLVCECPNAP